MDREELLELLFGDEPSLLQKDTGLRFREPVSVPETQDDAIAVKKNDTVAGQFESEVEVEGISVPGPQLELDLQPEPQPGLTSSMLSGTFCPAIALSRFPYKFIHDNMSQTVASEFFDGGKFWERTWDLYYLPVSAHISTRPLILIPVSQTEQLIQDINCKFNTCYTIPSANGFVLDFQDDGTGLPQPSFLGRSTSRSVKDLLETGIAAVQYDNRLDEAVPEYQAFEQKIEAAVQLCKSKSKTAASKAKRMQARLETELRWSKCLRQIQACFSFHQSTDPQPGKWKPDDAEEPEPPIHEPIFVSIDIESNERCHQQVTEIGISVLDTRDINGPPGQNASTWTSAIRSRHLRVREYAHVVNHDFVAGCPDRFEFGASEWVAREEAPMIVQEYIMRLVSGEEVDQKRNVILVGHSPSADIKYLQDMKVPVFKEAKTVFVDIVDTAEIYRVARQESNPRSLAGVLGELGVTAWNLHNAGNDARYTLQAMIMLAVDIQSST